MAGVLVKAGLRVYFARTAGLSSLRSDSIRLHPGVCIWVVEYRSVDGLFSAELMEFDAPGKVRRVLAHYSEGAA